MHTTPKHCTECLFPKPSTILHILPTVFQHRVTLQWVRWWMRPLAPSQRWHSTSRRCCGGIALPPNVMKRLSKLLSLGPCWGVYCSYLWVQQRATWKFYRCPVLFKNLSVFCLSTAQGICMTIGGIKHSEQHFNSRSAGVSSSLLFISIGGNDGSCT